jgi:hypothetical protein
VSAEYDFVTRDSQAGFCGREVNVVRNSSDSQVYTSHVGFLIISGQLPEFFQVQTPTSTVATQTTVFVTAMARKLVLLMNTLPICPLLGLYGGVGFKHLETIKGVITRPVTGYYSQNNIIHSTFDSLTFYWLKNIVSLNY